MGLEFSRPTQLPEDLPFRYQTHALLESPARHRSATKCNLYNIEALRGDSYERVNFNITIV